MEPDNQDEVIAFLGDPNTHHLSSAPKKIETHGAIVFLAGDQVYKIKRNVVYPYMDFSTPEKRKAACLAEIEVNRKNAPDLYVGTVPITRNNCRLQLGGQGHVVEWAVHMRRFDETRTLDRIAIKGELTPGVIDQLAGVVADNHRLAPVRFENDATVQIEKVIGQTLAELEKRCAGLDPNLLPRLSQSLQDAYRTNKAVLADRGRGGHVRRCHGDLHLGNIVLIEGQPVLFDAIEFDASLATIDTLYDLAFLVMDLCHRRLQPLACRLLNHYLWHSEQISQDIEGLALFPFFLALRACIGANVLAAQADLSGSRDQSSREIRAYLDSALMYLAPTRPIVMAIGGLSGSGKSTISDLLAPHFPPTPGAIQLRSDIERKRHFGVGQFIRLGSEAYSS
jgi:aminoglycoside phosphotransferase family enzyme